MINKYLISINTKISIIIISLSLTVLQLFPTQEIECMDNQQIKNTLDSYQQDTLTEEEAEALLVNLQEIDNPEQRVILRQIINEYARENNINVNAILPTDLQHNIEDLPGNSGNLPQLYKRTWIDVFVALGIAISLTLLAYLIMRNWEGIRDLLFDMGTRILELPNNINPQILYRVAGVLLQNPNTRYTFARTIIRGFDLNKIEE